MEKILELKGLYKWDFFKDIESLKKHIWDLLKIANTIFTKYVTIKI